MLIQPKLKRLMQEYLFSIWDLCGLVIQHDFIPITILHFLFTREKQPEPLGNLVKRKNADAPITQRTEINCQFEMLPDSTS